MKNRKSPATIPNSTRLPDWPGGQAENPVNSSERSESAPESKIENRNSDTSSNIKYLSSTPIGDQISNIRNPRVAIVHDWLYGGGAELVVEQLHKMYPEAPIFTSYCSQEWRKRLDNKVITGYLQHWPFAQLRKFLPVLRQQWFKNLDLSEFDLVISSSGNGEAKFVQVGNKQKVKSKKLSTVITNSTHLPDWPGGQAENPVNSSERSESAPESKIENRKFKNSVSTSSAPSSDIKYLSSIPIGGQISNMDAKRPLHICYCHTPTHFYWRKYNEYLSNPSFKPKWLVRLGLKLLVKPLRKRDYQAAQNADYFIANSSHIQKDIKKYYDRDSTVIHPPVNIAMFTNTKKQAPKNKNADAVIPGSTRLPDWPGGQAENPVNNTEHSESATQIENRKSENLSSSDIKYLSSTPIGDQISNMDKPRFITWGRHVPYKRFDLAIKACNELHLPLTIIGSGPETPALKKIAGPTITFTGYLEHEALVELARESSAFLFPGEEDFGIAPVEAMALGLPVIAYKSGGALDYVIDGKTGSLFNEQNVATLTKTLKQFDTGKYDPSYIATFSKKFSVKNFNENLKQLFKSKA